MSGAVVCLTFDVDAEANLAAVEDADLSSLSHGRYGVTRGLPSILRLLRDEDLPATFYVPGVTALRHPEAIRSIVDAGHEVGHHGHLHRTPTACTAEEQDRELDEGLAALTSVTGLRPAGYRSPAWSLTGHTLRRLVERGFAYDSSCMGDDRPYVERDGDTAILELPVHWALDDWPFFGYGPEGGRIADPGTFVATCRAEVQAAVEEARPVTITMHPEVIGRAHRLRALAALLRELRASGDVRFLSHRQLAAEVAPEVA